MKLSKERKLHYKKMLKEVDKFVKSGKKLNNIEVVVTEFGNIHLLRHECFGEKNYKIELVEL